MNDKIAELKLLSSRLESLVDDPRPELAMWSLAVGDVLQDIARFAGPPPATKEMLELAKMSYYPDELASEFHAIKRDFLAEWPEPPE